MINSNDSYDHDIALINEFVKFATDTTAETFGLIFGVGLGEQLWDAYDLRRFDVRELWLYLSDDERGYLHRWLVAGVDNGHDDGQYPRYFGVEND